MVTMVDQLFDQEYRAARGQLNGAIADGLRQVAKASRGAFEALNRIEYDAPWTQRPKRIFHA